MTTSAPGPMAGITGDAADAVRIVVLVIDDQPGIRGVMQRQLSRLGYTPLLAHDGADGLRLFDANAEDIRIVLLDWNMPGLSGAETLAALLARRQDLRVIVVTGGSADEMAAHGTVSMLQKPFTSATLSLAVRSALGVPA